MPGRAEHIAFAQDVGGNGVINRLGHLAGDKARPDQLVKLILVGGKRAFNLVGQQRDVRRADGFMRVLCRALGLEHARLAGVVFLAIASPDKGGNGGRCFISETHRVGTHIGDQTGHTNSLDIDALIQLLRDAHRAARGHVQLAGRLLLERGGDERRGHGLFLLTALDAADRELVPGNRRHDRHRLFFGFQLGFAVLVAVKAGGEFAALFGQELRVNRPVFLGDERADFLFPVDHQAGGNRLHAACRQPALDLAPQERGQAVADDSVQDAACLLGVNQVDIQVARMVNAVPHGVFGDFVKGYALGIGILELEQLLDVPGNGFALAVRVGCEKDKLACLRRLAQLGNQLVLALDRDVFGLEIVFEIDAHGLAGQVTQMTHGCLDRVVRAEIFSNRFRLCGRLDDDQF